MIPLDIGEWATAVAGLGIVLGVALVGVAGLGYWVIRGDRRNRELEAASSETSARQPHDH